MEKELFERCCLHCSKTFSTHIATKTFCTSSCQKKSHDIRRRRETTCKHCGKQYLAVKKRSTFCSVQCTGKYYASVYAKPKTAKRRNECLFCGKECQAKWCSSECAYVSTFKGRPQFNREIACQECGMQVIGRAKQKYCSLRCLERVAGRNRRARLRSAYMETVHMNEIAERDEWRCQICGNLTSKKYDNLDPLSPTIDHIIPLSKGGKHCKGNCQLSHLQCNSLKGDKI